MTFEEYLKSLQGRSVAVIGIGVSNQPLIQLLLSRGISVTACDKKSRETLGPLAEELEKRGCRLRLGEDYLQGLNQDIIFRTPGMRPDLPELTAAVERGSLLTSEMEVFFQVCPCTKIAVTGSDGKTTTTTIISEILKAAGYRVHLGGNIGHPLLCETPDIRPDDIAVLELSSFQLHSMRCHPDVAVITNLSPNHLDKHKDFQDYIDAKRAIYAAQNENDTLVLNLDDEHSAYYRSFAKGKISWFSDEQPVTHGTMCRDGVICRVIDEAVHEIMPVSEIKLPGEHNVLNYLAAFAAVEGLADDDACRSVARSFGGVEHRLELVRELRGVTYINDSIGSSPTRTINGLRAMKTKPIVIAGGYDKHIPFDGLGDELCRMAKRVYLTGATAEKIRAAILGSQFYAGSGLDLEMIDDFDECVLAAANVAKAGDIVLFSPACASFDRFKNFEERGKHFKKLITELK